MTKEKLESLNAEELIRFEDFARGNQHEFDGSQSQWADYALRLITEVRQRREQEKHYGWGIIDKDGKPWWDEACVCEDKHPMADAVASLNDEDYADIDPRCPYRVAELFWRVLTVEPQETG